MNKTKMDIFYFQKYSKYVKQNDGIKSGINLFLTLRGCRASCYIKIHKCHENSLIRILTYYKMHYDIRKYEDNDWYDFIISKKHISEEVKYAFNNPDYDRQNPHVMGKFLDYLDFFNVRDRKSKNVGRIEFSFMKNRTDIKKNKKEIIYGFRIRNAKITPTIIKEINNRIKKYQRCIKKHLKSIFPEFIVQMSIALY